MGSAVYLDYAAATPLDRRVLAAMQPHLTNQFANPSSLHAPGRHQRAALEDARHRLAQVLGAKPAEIRFTSGSTESANLAIQGVMRPYPTGRVVATGIEHDAILKTLEGLEAEGGQTSLITVPPAGVVDPVQIIAAIDDQTALLCVQYVNNEIGAIQPLARIAAEVARIRVDRIGRGVEYPLYLYCDAAQAGLLSLQVSRLGIDLLSMGGAKLYGPSGSGFLYVRAGTALTPVWFGGGQEDGVRSGTENVAAAVGLAAALELAQDGRVAEAKRQTALRDLLWQEVSEHVPGLSLNGDPRHQAPGFLNMTVADADGETLVVHLDAAGVAAATGSACTAANQKPSHVLMAIGRSPAEAASSLRLTLGRPTTKAEVQRAAKALIQVIPRVRELSATHPVQ